MAGGREYVEMEALPLAVGFAIDSGEQVVVNTEGNIIGIIIIIAEEGGAVDNGLTQKFFPFKVLCDGTKNPFHRKVPASKTCFLRVARLSVTVPRPVH